MQHHQLNSSLLATGALGNHYKKVAMCAGTESVVSPGRGEEEAQESSKQPLPSLTPGSKPANRAAVLRSSWSHPASVSSARSDV